MSVFLTPDGPAVLRRHVLPRHAAPRHAVVPPGARGRPDARGRRSGRRSSRRACGSSTRWSSSRAIGTGGRAVGAAAARGARRRPRPAVAASFDPVHGGWGGAPKFPQPMTIEFLLRRHVAAGDARAARGRAAEPRRDGGGRHPRPAGRRLPPLRDRRGVARARTSSRCSTTTPSSPACTSHAWALTGDASLLATATGGARLPAARAARRRTAGSRPARTRTPRARRARRSSGRPARCARSLGDAAAAVRGRVRGHRRAATGRAGRSCRGSAATPSSRSGSGCRPARSRPGWPRRARVLLRRRGARPQPALRRQGARGLERARDRGARRRRAVARRDRRAGAGRGGGALRARRRRGAAAAVLDDLRAAGRPAPTLVEGRPGVGRRRARGLREPRGRAARAVRGDVRRALVRGRGVADGRGPRALRRTPTAASTTRPTTASGWSSGRGTSRTTRRRRAARWRRPSSSGSRR